MAIQIFENSLNRNIFVDGTLRLSSCLFCTCAVWNKRENSTRHDSLWPSAKRM